jgi:FG-GAP-like repeat
MPTQKKCLIARVLLCLVFSSVGPLVIAQVNFSDPASYPVGTSPTAIAVADFNGDGKPDLAVANSGDPNTNDDGNVSILLGKGDGTFQGSTTFNAGKNPWSIAVGDFNRDGKKDLAVLDGGEASVSILFGKGDGSFQPVMKYNLDSSGYPAAIAAADLDGDGTLDLAVAGGGDGISILLGNHDGTFQPAVNFSISATLGLYVFDTSSLTIGDFNEDKKLDIAVVSQTFPSGGESRGYLSVFVGNGDGTFQSPIQTAIGGGSFSIAAGDFNGDGKLDVVVTPDPGPFVPVPVVLLLGNGDGTFQARQDLDPAQGGIPIPHHFAAVAGDFNNDGKFDVAVLVDFVVGSGAAPPPVLRLLLGNGDGTFQTPQDSDLSTLPWSLSAGDFNLNGSLDAAVANSESNNISVLLNNSGPGSLPDFSLSASPLSPGTVAAGQSATGTVSMALTDGFNKSVSFTCSVQPAPAHAPTCSFNPSSSTSGTTLTVNTTTPTSARISSSAMTGLSYAIWLPLIGLMVVGASLGSTQAAKRRVLGFLLWSVLLTGLASQSACGGGAPSSSGGGTPTETYTVTVTGTSESIHHSAAVTLTVQ